MNQLTLPIRNLLGQPIRSTLTTLGVAVAVGGFVAMTGLTQGLQYTIERGIEEPGADLVVSQRGAYGLISGSVPAALEETLAGIEGIEKASGALLNVTVADNDANIVIAGWPTQSFLWQNVRLIEGRIPTAADEWGVVLGESIAGVLGKRLGDTVELQFESYQVIGIARFTTILNQNIALVPLPGLQKLMGRGDTVTLIQVRLSRPLDPARVTSVRARLSAALPEYAVSDTAEFAGSMRFNRQISAIAATIGLLVMGMAALAVANTLLMAVSERTYELGILAAVGWTPARILAMILVEGLLMSAVGGIAGLAFGVLTMHLVSQTHMAAGLLEPYLTWTLLAQSLVSVLVIGPLGALYPAWRAVRMQPAQALRAM
jgi:putative ABC transport system permease protein